MAKKNYFETITKEISLGKARKVFFNWIFVVALVGPYLSSIILFGMYAASPASPPSWINWVLFAIFVPSLLASMFATQKEDLVGAYGEAILILIPTFVWLLAGHTSSIRYLIIMNVAIVFAGIIFYIAGVVISIRGKQSMREKKISRIFFRIAFIAASVASTVAISVILLNWADISLQLSRLKSDFADYTSSPWILFISLVTISVALLLVVLGLMSNYETVVRVKKVRTRPSLLARIKNRKIRSYLNKTIDVNSKNKKQFKG